MISIIKSLHRLIGQNGIRLVPSILLSMLDSVLNSCMYGVMLFVLIDLSNGQFSAEGLKMCIIAVVIIFTLRCIVQGISFTQAQCVGPDVSHKLRISMGNHIRSLNLGFFTKNSIGKLSGTLLTDINDFETIITHCLCDVIKVTSLTILSLVIAFMLDWHFGLAVTLLVGIALPLLVISGKVSARNSDELRTANRTVVSRIIEYISGMRTFRLYNLIGKRFDRLDNALKELRKQSTKAEISILPLSMSFSAITAMIVPVSLILGTWLLTSTEINGASFLLAIQRRKVKDFFIKFKKKSHFADFLTEQTLDFVLHRLFCGLAEMHTDDIGGLADLLSDSRARGTVGCGIVHSKSSCK